MEDYPAKIADLLETVAVRIRSMTVDRVRVWVTWGAVGLVAAMLASLVLVFLFVGLFRPGDPGRHRAGLPHPRGHIPDRRAVLVVAPAPQGWPRRRGVQWLTSGRDTEQVVVIGSGPAGLTAAVYAARADLSPLLIEGFERGGQLMLTTEVENYPGFPDGILGPELMEQFRKQAERFGTRIVAADVTGVDLAATPLQVRIGEDRHQTEALIIATGASARWLGVPGEDKLRGHGVSSCATCDGFFFRDRRLVVVGGGDSAMEEAMFLDQVRLARHRDPSPRRVPRLEDHGQPGALPRPHRRDVGHDGRGGPRRRDRGRGAHRDMNTGETSEMAVDGVFVAIGHTPNTGVFADKVDTDDAGYIVTNPGTTRTNVPGVFAAGDVVDKVYRQAITAAGMGCQAALEAERWLEDRHHGDG